MKLLKSIINKEVIIKKINILDEKYNIRLQELGLYEGAKIVLLNFSPLKQTMLVKIFNSVFAIKSDVANLIEVEE